MKVKSRAVDAKCRRFQISLWIVYGLLIWPDNYCVAAPAGGDKAIVLQPDGTPIQAYLRGDEYISWYEDSRGFAMLKDTDGYWKHAKPCEHKLRYVTIPGAIINRVNPADIDQKPNVRPSRKLLMDLRNQIHASPNTSALKFERPARLELSQALLSPSSESPLRAAVILAAFHDHWDEMTDSVIASKGYPPSTYDNLFNEEGHDYDGAAGSVRDYFSEVSYGQLDIDFKVSPWVKLPHIEAWYGDNANETIGEQRVRILAENAVDAAANAGYDFADRDGSGDGWVDLLIIIHSGHSESVAGNSSHFIWPRQWSFLEPRMHAGVWLNQFAISSALRGAQTTREIARIGMICHEIGHLFGLKDVYDLSQTTYGVGVWDLMGYGAWGASWSVSSQHKPTHLGSYHKWRLGFLEPALGQSAMGIQLPPLAESPHAYLIKDGLGEHQEYFMIEHRGGHSFDSELPRGLLIWHIHDLYPQNESSSFAHFLARIEEADGQHTLSESPLAHTSHVWNASSALAEGFRDNTSSTNSNAMRYQDHLFARTLNENYFSHIRVSNFSLVDDVITFDMQTLAPSIIHDDGGAARMDTLVSWHPSSEAQNYELQKGLWATNTYWADGAEDYDAWFQHWTHMGAPRRSSETARSGSWSYMLSPLSADGSQHLSRLQSLTTRKPFRISTNTSLQFYFRSAVAQGYGALYVQISTNAGLSWVTLDSIAGYQDSWAQKSYDYNDIQAVGIQADSICHLRFFMQIHRIWGWSLAGLHWGYALDDILLTNITYEVPGHWETLTDQATTAEMLVANLTPGMHAFRVRAYAGGQWRQWSPAVWLNVSAWSDYEQWVASRIPDPALRDPELDADLDGYSNWEEFIADTDPLDDSSFFPPLSMHRDGATLHLEIESTSTARLYHVEKTHSLQPAAWVSITNKPGAGGRWIQAYPLHPDSNAFFRSSVMLP